MLYASSRRKVCGADGEGLGVISGNIVHCKMQHVGGDIVVVFDGYPHGDVDTFGVETYLEMVVATLKTDGNGECFFDIAVDGKEEAHAVGRGVQVGVLLPYGIESQGDITAVVEIGKAYRTGGDFGYALQDGRVAIEPYGIWLDGGIAR